MRLRIGEHEVEGTVEEVAKLLMLLQPSHGAGTNPEVLSGGTELSPFISEEMAFNVLTRRALGEPHAKLLQALYGAGEKWTPATELQAKLGLSTREFAGLLGAFGKRITHTEGTGSRAFFDQYWDPQNGFNLYRLPSSVRAAVRRAGIV